jgi:sensor histidine kinase YesM
MKIKPSLYWRCQLIGWGLNCLSHSFSIFLLGFGSTEALMVIVTVTTGLPVSHLMRTALVKLKVTQKSVKSQIIYFLCITLIFAVIDSFAWIGLISRFEYRFVSEPNFWGRFIQLCNESFFLILNWNFIYFTYHYVKSVRKKDQAKLEMQQKMFELEAFALRAQMNPHFIFNCLNSIKSLIQDHEEEKAVTYLTTFSKLIRTLFNNADKKEISLYDEIETCKLYLQLETMRFDAKFSHSVNVNENIDLKSIKVPALIIQPFIENAIWHGIVPKETAGRVEVNVKQINDSVEVIIDDNGIGREASGQNKSASGLAHQSKGVNLTQSRLDLENRLNETNARLEMIDKKDNNGQSAGTRIILTFANY